jgi:hypothetical protein
VFLLCSGRKDRTIKNLNIKSDEAYELAHFIAKRKGQNLTAVVTELPCKEKRELTRDERLARIDQIARDSAKKWKILLPGEKYDDFLYDELGLPR